MPVEFTCPQCSRILRVSDEHAGKTARCPDCSTIMIVPGDEAPPENPSMKYGFGGMESPMPVRTSGAFPEKPAPSRDPWSRVQGHQGRPAPAYAGDAQIRPAVVGFDSIMDYAAKACRDHYGMLFGVHALVVGAGLFFGLTQAIVDEVIQPGVPGAVTVPGTLIGLIGNLVSIYLGIGQVRINYDIARSGRARFETLFSGGDKLLPVIGACLLAGVAMVVGLVCLIIPGLILMALFWPFFHLIADNKETAIESFATAFEIGKINIGTTLVLVVVTILISIGGLLALLIGFLFVLPFLSMLWSVAYLKMAGQI